MPLDLGLNRQTASKSVILMPTSRSLSVIAQARYIVGQCWRVGFCKHFFFMIFSVFNPASRAGAVSQQYNGYFDTASARMIWQYSAQSASVISLVACCDPFTFHECVMTRPLDSFTSARGALRKSTLCAIACSPLSGMRTK